LNLRDFRVLADENVHPAVLAALRGLGFDAISSAAVGLMGADDRAVLRYAFSQQRLVLTHDADFGKLAVADREPLIGIVYLRPGHIDPAFTMAGLRTLLAKELEIVPPFIVVVRRTKDRVQIRLRHLA
jgi:predicted nuclease of predicted toxin-antitoxin system